MQNCIGIINSGYETDNYKTLAQSRPDYMLPFGGRYRLVDFSLSNLSHYNMSNVILFAGKSIRSTLDHVGNGKTWELNRRRNGLVINPPSYEAAGGQIQNEIDYYFDALSYFDSSKAEDVYVLNPMILSKVNLQEAYQEFNDNDYDVMFLYAEVTDPLGKFLNADKLITNADGKLVNIGVNLGTENTFNLFLGKTFIKKDVFVKLVKTAKERANASNLTQAILNAKSELKIGIYGLAGHVEFIRDTKSFYDANMNLLNEEVFNQMFNTGGQVLTKAKDEPSTSYRQGANVTNSILANGCILEGQVENSILFRGVTIGKGAIVKNSILFENTTVEDGAIIVNAITDRNVTVEKSVTLVGTPTIPYVVPKGSVIKRS